MVTFPIDMFLPGSDLAPLRARKREFYDGLTRWQSGFAQDAAGAAPMLSVEGASYEDALNKANNLLITAVEAFLDAESNSDQLQATSGGPFPVVIVNGPIAKEIRLNSGFGCLGQDPQRPASASIGRALRLLQQKRGGALPGIGTMAIFGVMRYTNAVFAEDEAALPQGWQPHATERHGFAPGTNSVSLVLASGVTNIRRRGAKKETPQEDVPHSPRVIGRVMRVPESFDRLLADADRDLGCGADACRV